jgi:hypothetical protein
MRSFLAAAMLASMVVPASAQMVGVNVSWRCDGIMASFLVGNPGGPWPAPVRVVVQAAGDPMPLLQKDLMVPPGQSLFTDPILSAGRFVQIKVEPVWPGGHAQTAVASCR